MTRTNAMLVFPADPDLRLLADRRVPLTLTTQHSRSRDGLPVLVDGDGEVLTDEAFRQLRVRLGVWIETDNQAVVRGALGVPQDEPGIVAITCASPSGGSLNL
jgi:hypothetical protein